MSPEVILCRGHSTKADIYSLGATLIHMQTGTPPWVKRYPRSAYPSYLYIVSRDLPGRGGRSPSCSPSFNTPEGGGSKLTIHEMKLKFPPTWREDPFLQRRHCSFNGNLLTCALVINYVAFCYMCNQKLPLSISK